MPYWTYKKVKSGLNFRYKPKVFDKYLVKMIKRDKLVELFLGNKWEAHNDKLDQIVDSIMSHPAALQNAQEFDSEEFRREVTTHVITDHVNHLMFNEMCESNTLNFFLEPVIAKALATTSVRGLSLADIGTIPHPVRIFVPDNLLFWEETDGTKAALKEVGVINVHDHVQHGEVCNINIYDVSRAKKVFVNKRGFLSHKDNPLEKLIGEDPLHDVDDKYETSEETQGRVLRLKLILNTLLYYTSEDSDILRQLNPNYDKVKRGIKEAVGKRKERLEQTLKTIPKDEHYIFGPRLKVLQKRRKDVVLSDESPRYTGTGSPKRPHNRDGHWRWQRYGKENSKIKLKFIDPMPIKGGVEELGYSVRS
jgi:hypothetical protein